MTTAMNRLMTKPSRRRDGPAEPHRCGSCPLLRRERQAGGYFTRTSSGSRSSRWPTSPMLRTEASSLLTQGNIRFL